MESATATLDDQNVFRPVVTEKGLPMTDLFLEPNGRLTLRDSAGQLWRAGAQFQPKNATFALCREVEDPIVYNFSQLDSTHLILTPTDRANGTLYLTSVALHDHYPLLDTGFHFVNEWPFER